MTSGLTKEQLRDLREFFAAHQAEMLAFVRALVETESPSGDVAGSRAVVDLISERAGRIGVVDSLDRIIAPDFGEHLRIRAFAESNRDAQSIVMLGHTDTVHPRGSITARPR